MTGINLKTKRLTSVELHRSHSKSLFKIFSDPQVTRFFSFEAMTEISDAEQFIDRVEKGREDGSLLEWGIAHRKSGELIGTCAYSGWNKQHRAAELGFALRRDHWNKGLMKEWLPGFIRYGFEELDLHRIQADADPRNVASIRLLEYLGFLSEGYLRECYRLNGEIQDAVILSLLKTDIEDRI